MMNKKAQSQIITTVLIILLVLAAVVIVWQVVQTTVEDSSSEITATTACIGTEFSVDITAADSITVTRKSGGTSDNVGVRVLVDGASQGDASGVSLGPLETSGAIALSPVVADGELVEVAAVVGETVCPVGGSATYTA